MRKIRRYTEWQSMPYKEKSQYDEFERIKTMSRNSGIPKIIIDEALRQHKKLSEMKTFRGSNREGIIAASVYIAGRIHDYPRTAKEIASVFHLNNAAATKGCKNATNLLNTSAALESEWNSVLELNQNEGLLYAKEQLIEQIADLDSALLTLTNVWLTQATFVTRKKAEKAANLAFPPIILSIEGINVMHDKLVSIRSKKIIESENKIVLKSTILAIGIFFIVIIFLVYCLFI
jgi:hypothetical protein